LPKVAYFLFCLVKKSVKNCTKMQQSVLSKVAQFFFSLATDQASSGTRERALQFVCTSGEISTYPREETRLFYHQKTGDFRLSRLANTKEKIK